MEIIDPVRKLWKQCLNVPMIVLNNFEKSSLLFFSKNYQKLRYCFSNRECAGSHSIAQDGLCNAFAYIYYHVLAQCFVESHKGPAKI